MFTFPNSEKIVCVTNRGLCPLPLEEQTERIAAAGVKRIILREKDLSENEYISLAERVLESCNRCGTELIIHSFPQAARWLGIGKIHMPLNLLTAELCEEFDVVGSSVHSLEQLETAQKLGAAYVTAGHIFATDCKRNLPPRGLDFLSDICKSADIPVLAIGGINAENMQSALDSGAKGVCIMSGLMKI
jgi:thiamine-phosphate pyrophosphorylase